MTTISDFIEKEKRKMSWLDKAVMNYPTIHKTSFLSSPLAQSTPEVVIRPSILNKLITIPFILFGGAFYIPLVNIMVNQKLPILIPLIGILFLSFILYLLIWHSFLNPNYIYRFRINREYIEASGKKHYWTEISETCIMTKMEGRNSNSYLVIFKKEGSVEKSNLFKFRISRKKLAGIIEFYKTSS
jgi:hypothetical protein